MNALFMLWWRDRSERERSLVALTGVLAIIVLGWLALVRPLAMARTAAEARHSEALAGLAEVAAAGNGIRAAQARGSAASNVPLVELVSERARTAGLTVETMATSGDGQVSLRIAAVKPAVVLRWIGDFERNDGILVERTSIARNDDASVAVDLVLRRGGR
jgi:general secretion pathway protein M